MNIARQANEEDIGQIVQLNLTVQEIHSSRYPDIFKKEVDTDKLSDFYFELISDKNQYVFVAEHGGLISGYCWAEFSQRRETPLKNEISKLYLHQISVEEKFRGKGIGITLINEIKNIAANLNVNHIGVDSWSFNGAAIGFFKSQGFVTCNERMWLK